MRIQPVSRIRTNRILLRHIERSQQAHKTQQVEQTQKTHGADRLRNRYRRKLVKRRVWSAPACKREPSYHLIGLSNIDHSPYELSINDIEIN